MNRPDPQKGRISPRFTVQDFYQSTSSEASLHTAHLDCGDDFTAGAGAVAPAKAPHQPEHAAGIARLINAWNPAITINRSDFRDSDASKLCARADNTPSLFQENSGLPSAPSGSSMLRVPASSLASQNARPSQRNQERPSPDSIQRLTVKRPRHLSRACFACGERETPQWRCGPSGINTLCNFCGLMYVKRQAKRSAKNHHRTKEECHVGADASVIYVRHSRRGGTVLVCSGKV